MIEPESTPEPVSDILNCCDLVLLNHYYMKIKFVKISEEGEKLEDGDILLKVELIEKSANKRFINKLAEKLNMNYNGPLEFKYKDPYYAYLSFGQMAVNECFAYFRILRVVSTNINIKNEVTDYSASKLITVVNNYYNTIETYFTPGSLMWVVLGRDDTIEITSRRPVIPKEEDMSTIERFLSLFPDYNELVAFLNTDLKNMSPYEYELYYKHMTPLDFTTRAPAGYSFLEIPEDATITNEVLYGIERDITHNVLGNERSFYRALKYIYSRINHFSPSIIREGLQKSEHSYFIMLNRLIYYYNIYLSFIENKLQNGFSDSAFIVINTHGGYTLYERYEYIPPSKNIFMCTKASIGSLGFCRFTDSAYLYRTFAEMFIKMYRDVERYSFISFDKIIIEEYKNIPNPHSQANPRIEVDEFAKSMQHYINPQKHKYIKKTYSTGNDEFNTVIDIETFIETHSIDDSNILNDRRMRVCINPDNTKKFTLDDIVDYYFNVKRKTNIFIYDTSCGSSLLDSKEDITKIKNYYSNCSLQTEEEKEYIKSRKQTLTNTVARITREGLGKKQRKTTKKKKTVKRKNKTKKNKRYR